MTTRLFRIFPTRNCRICFDLSNFKLPLRCSQMFIQQSMGPSTNDLTIQIESYLYFLSLDCVCKIIKKIPVFCRFVPIISIIKVLTDNVVQCLIVDEVCITYYQQNYLYVRTYSKTYLSITIIKAKSCINRTLKVGCMQETFGNLTCVNRTHKLAPWMFGLDRVHCIRDYQCLF